MKDVLVEDWQWRRYENTSSSSCHILTLVDLITGGRCIGLRIELSPHFDFCGALFFVELRQCRRCGKWTNDAGRSIIVEDWQCLSTFYIRTPILALAAFWYWSSFLWSVWVAVEQICGSAFQRESFMHDLTQLIVHVLNQHVRLRWLSRGVVVRYFSSNRLSTDFMTILLVNSN